MQHYGSDIHQKVAKVSTVDKLPHLN